MKIIDLNTENIDREHICCVFSDDQKNAPGIARKKHWLLERFKEGLKFKKIDVSDKAFIEYMPAEYAWRAIEAPGFMFIQCIWVSGKYKHAGHGSTLLAECEKDAAGMKGVVVVNSKKPWMADKRFFQKKGYELCDKAPPYFELMVKRFDENADHPVFTRAAKNGYDPDLPDGITIAYSDQCPFTTHYTKEMKVAFENHGFQTTLLKLETADQAQRIASPYGSFSVFLNGHFLTHEIMNTKRVDKLVGTLDLEIFIRNPDAEIGLD